LENNYQSLEDLDLLDDEFQLVFEEESNSYVNFESSPA